MKKIHWASSFSKFERKITALEETSLMSLNSSNNEPFKLNPWKMSGLSEEYEPSDKSVSEIFGNWEIQKKINRVIFRNKSPKGSQTIH